LTEGSVFGRGSVAKRLEFYCVLELQYCPSLRNITCANGWKRFVRDWWRWTERLSCLIKRSLPFPLCALTSHKAALSFDGDRMGCSTAKKSHKGVPGQDLNRNCRTKQHPLIHLAMSSPTYTLLNISNKFYQVVQCSNAFPPEYDLLRGWKYTF